MSKSVERRLAGHLPWLVLGFNPGKRTVVIAGFAGTEQEATAKAVSRASGGEYAYPHSKVFCFNDNMAADINSWLKHHGVQGLKRIQIIQKIGREIEKMMPSAPTKTP